MLAIEKNSNFISSIELVEPNRSFNKTIHTRVQQIRLSAICVHLFTRIPATYDMLKPRGRTNWIEH
jgi:hypothetical protein